MNLKQLHEWFGKLLEAGVDPKLGVTCLVDGWPCEVSDAALASSLETLTSAVVSLASNSVDGDAMGKL